MHRQCCNRRVCIMMSLGNTGKAMQAMTLEPEYRLRSYKRHARKCMMRKCILRGVLFFYKEGHLMKKLFKLEENGTTLVEEIRAGLTTFVAMGYIIFLNPVLLSATGMNASGVLAATCLSAALGTTLSAFLSNKPFAMASGMGMNAYFTYTLCFGYGYTWQQALALTFLSGCVFLAVALLMGKKAVSFIPENLRHAITAGIGVFILLIGLLDAGIIQMTAGFPELGDLGSLSVITALVGLLSMTVLTILNVRGSLIVGMMITVVFSLLTKQTSLPDRLIALPTAIKEVSFQLDFAGLFNGDASIATVLAVILSMSIVDMFDTLGFLVGVTAKTSANGCDAGQLDRILVADAGATVIGTLCGTSTVTVYAESAAGVEAGGRTGLAALTTAFCFLLALFFSPAASVFSSAITAPALIIVGICLLMDIRKVRFDSMDDVIPAMLTVVMIPFAYSITVGIAVGFLSYLICKLAARKYRELNFPSVIICLIFILYICYNF